MPNTCVLKRTLIGGRGGRTRSASVGRDKSDLRARYWASLFDNLQHAIYNLYQTCETDDNISECEEVILVLENYTREFHDLAKRFRMKCEYDNALPSQRPTSVAWGVSKSSPGKIFRKSCQPKYDSSACRELIFDLDPLSTLDAESIGTIKLNVSRMNSVEGNCKENDWNMKTKLSKPRNIDCSCQTEDDTSIMKTAPLRKVINSPSFPRKLIRNLSKPIPGRNIGAPVFIPGKKPALFNSVDSKISENSIKVKISRSKSDSTFEASNSLIKSEHNKKPYASVECVKTDPREEEPKFVTRKYVQVIDELKFCKLSKEVLTETNENSSTLDTIVESLPASVSDKMDLKTTFIDLKIEGSKGTKSSESVSSPEKSHSIVSTNRKSEPSCSSIARVKSLSCAPKDIKSLPIQNTFPDVKPNPLLPQKPLESKKPEPRKFRPQRPNPHTRLSTLDRKLYLTQPAIRKIIPVPAHSLERAFNQSYVKNVGVPKERRPQAEKIPLPISEPVRLPDSPTPSSYSTAIKSNNKEFHNVPLNRHPNIIRSKTSIDIEPKLQSPKSAPSKTFNEERELSLRKRSSEDTDGWETVISRSRRSFPNSVNLKYKSKAFDVSRRFYEPSPSTSLPTLINSSGKEKSSSNSKLEKNNSRNRNASFGNYNKGHEKTVVANTHLNHKLNKERPILSNTAMFTTIPSKKKKASEKNFKKTNKRKSSKEMDEQIEDDLLLNEESLRKSKELYEEEISLQQEINDLQNDGLEIDLDSDSTEVESEMTDNNRGNETVERRALLEAKYSHLLSKLGWAEQVETMDKLESMMIELDPNGKSLKYAKDITSLKQFEDFMARWPGRALELHQKLSSPSRKRISPDSTILQHKARQAKAKQKRDQLLQDKAYKMKELFIKVADVKAQQAMLTEERRKSLDRKLKRAEENRNLYLKNIQEKAHDEAKKQKEIAFINELEAQNKRHNLNTLFQEQEGRLRNILEERQKRQEEKKTAKEAAAEERRKAIETERLEKMEELQEKMRRRDERIDREQQEKERERIKMAREKARDREDRLLALQAAQIANVEELQKKIQQKQESSARRHEENIESIRQRAIEIGTPRLTPYQINKLCSICNVVIDSEVFLLSHLRGINHQEALKKYREQFEANIKFSECSIIMEAPAEMLQEKKSKEKERQKTLRHRCKKIRQRLNGSSEKYLNDVRLVKEQLKKADTVSEKKILKSIKEIEKLISTQDGGSWSNNAVTMLERNLFEISRILEKGNKNDQQAFSDFDGFIMLSKIYNFALDFPRSMSPYLPLKCFVVASNLYTRACKDNVENCLYVLLSSNIMQLLEFLLSRLNLIMPNSDDRNGTVVYKADTVADVLMNLCSSIFSSITPLLTKPKATVPIRSQVSKHLQDVVSYIVCTGIVDKLAVYCSSVHDNKSADSHFLLHAIQLLTRMVETRSHNISDKDDSTCLMATLKATELVGAVSMLYAMLLHQISLSTDAQLGITVLEPDVVKLIMATLELFSRVCELNLEFFQNILGAEGISLQVRHIVSYLLKYCIQNEGYTDLLHQVIKFIGFFAVHHHNNQMILQSGSTPTVLQQLFNLPFAYFSNPKLVRILFPTLLACCVDNPQNKMILDQEMSFQLLEDFKNSDESKGIPLIKLLH